MKIFGDRPRKGTHYADRYHRILGTCHQMGVLWEIQRSSYHGTPQEYRTELVKSTDTVILTPQYEKYGLRVSPKVLQRIRGMAPQFAYALNVPAVAVEVDGDTVYIRVPREGASTGLDFEQAWALAPDVPQGSLLLGILDDGTQGCLDLVANVHCAVIGMTGSGKSTLMRTMILSAEMVGAPVVLCDPLRRGFWALSGHPSVQFGGMFADPRRIEQALGLLVQRVRTARDDSTLYVFVDEVPELVRQRPKIAEHLGVIASMGRHAGVHLVLGSQTALSSALGELTVKNLPCVLLGKVRSAQDSYSASGRAEVGAELLRGAGDMICISSAGTTHFQAAQPSQGLLDQWARRYPPSWGKLPALPAERTPASSFVRMQSTAVVQLPCKLHRSTDDGPEGEPGRPEEEPSRRMVCWAASWWKEHGAPPTLTAIYDQSKRWYAKLGGYGRPKARRCIEQARALVEGAK